MGQLLTVVAIADLPTPGQPASAIDAFAVNDIPTRFTKRNSYSAVEFGFTSSFTGSGDYALYRYWPTDQDWKPEGPRGATPTTIDMATVAGQVPVRVSVLEVETELCVVLTSGTGVDDGGDAAPVVIEAQNR